MCFLRRSEFRRRLTEGCFDAKISEIGLIGGKRLFSRARKGGACVRGNRHLLGPETQRRSTSHACGSISATMPRQNKPGLLRFKIDPANLTPRSAQSRKCFVPPLRSPSAGTKFTGHVAILRLGRWVDFALRSGVFASGLFGRFCHFATYFSSPNSARRKVADRRKAHPFWRSVASRSHR